jgi:hypothetical protein
MNRKGFMRLALSFVMVLSLGLAQQATQPPTPAPQAPAPVSKVTPIPASYMTDFNKAVRQFQSDVEILRLRTCADAGLHYSKCVVRWEQGFVVEVTPPPGPQTQLPQPEDQSPQ